MSAIPGIPRASAGQNVMEWIAPAESVTMSRHQLILEIDRARRRTVPHGEWTLIPLGLLLGLLPTVATDVTFHDAFGMKAAVWQAIVIICAVMAALATAVCFVWWVVVRMTRPERTSEQIAADILLQLQLDNERVARIVKAATPSAAPTASPLPAAPAE